MKGEIKSKSEEGIFIVGRRGNPRFSMELPLDYAIESVDRHERIAANASKSGLLV